MMWNNKNIFEPSGCISREAFEAYINGKLPDDVRALVDTHLKECPFCSEAKEGFENNASKSSISEILEISDKQFGELIETKNKKQINKRVLWTAISAAASVLIIALLINILNKDIPVEQIAENTKTISDTILPEKTLKSKPKNNTPGKIEHRRVENRKFPPEHVETEAVEKAEIEEELTNTSAINEALAEMEIGDAAEKKDIVTVSDTVGDPTVVSYNAPVKYESRANPASGGSLTKRSTERIATGAKSIELADEKFTADEEPPKFRNGGVSDFQKYLQNQISQITDSTKVLKISVQFIVNEKGRIEDARIINDSNSEYDSLIIKKINQSPPWTPAMQNGIPQKVQFIIPVLIRK